MLLALAACTPSRPDRAYTPLYDAGACVVIPGINSCDEPDASGNTDDDSDDVASDDTDGSDDDAGIDAGMEPDTGPVDPGNPLTKLAGKYLMRIDYYSTATGKDATSGTTLTVKNRVSNLFLTTLTAGDGVLQADEQLCVQGSQHLCLMSCNNWATKYDQDLPPIYLAKSKVSRAWTIDPVSRVLTVKTDGALLPLGFDPIDGQFTLPTDINASNVWQAGSTNAAVQRALHTYVSGTLVAVGGVVMTPLSCNINSVMVFGTAFGGTLASLDENALDGFVQKVDTTGSGAQPIDATGDPTQFCSVSKLAGGGGSQEQAFVRFKRTSMTATCPKTADAYQTAFPLSADTELDPPK